MTHNSLLAGAPSDCLKELEDGLSKLLISTKEHLVDCEKSEFDKLEISPSAKKFLRMTQYNAKLEKYFQSSLCDRIDLARSMLLSTYYKKPLALSGTDLTNCDLRQLLGVLINQKVLPPMYFGESATSLLQTLGGQFRDTDANKLVGNNVCKLLLGVQGCGKSTLLQSIALAASSLYRNTVVLFIDMKQQSYLPSEMIYGACSALNIMLQGDPRNLEDMLSALRGASKRCVLLVDEFHHVYHKENGKEIIEQLYALGKSTEGICWALVSGSAAVLRDLAFGNLNVKYNSEYKVLTNGDKPPSLNNKRYTILTLSPIQSQNEFKQLMEHIKTAQFEATSDTPTPFFTPNEEAKQNCSEALEIGEMLDVLFIASGGLLRNLNTALQSPKEAIQQQLEHITTHTDDNLCKRLWNALLESWLEQAAIWKMPILTQSKVEEILQGLHLTMVDLYNLADKSACRIIFSEYSLQVTFAHPLHLQYWKFRRMESTLPTYDQICLRWPYGQLGIDAEGLLLDSLCKKIVFHNLLLKYNNKLLSMASASGTSANINDIFAGHASLQNMVCLVPSTFQSGNPYYHVKDINLELLKDYPDKYGADACVIDLENRTAYRIQIKLGSSELQRGMPRASTIASEKVEQPMDKAKLEENNVASTASTEQTSATSSPGSTQTSVPKRSSKNTAHDIINQLQKGRQSFLNVLKFADPTITWDVIDVVMTTRPLTDMTIAYFKQHNVEVWKKEQLWNVWTPQITAMDRMYQLGVYAPLEKKQINSLDNASVTSEATGQVTRQQNPKVKPKGAKTTKKKSNKN